jgi:hypothetical protein
MDDAEHGNQTENDPDLFMRLRALENTALPTRVRNLAASYGKRFTNLCIQPYELLTDDPSNDLSPERQDHLRSCFLCALVVGDRESIRALASSGAVAAAEAAARASLNERGIAKPRWRPFRAATWRSLGEKARAFARAVTSLAVVIRLAEATRSVMRLRFLFRTKPEAHMERASTDPTPIL